MKFIIVAIAAFALLGCEQKQPESSQTAAQEAQEPTEEKVELTFAFQPQENPEGLMPNAKKLAAFVSEQTGYDVEIFVPSSYAAVVEAMRGDKAQVAYFSAWPYLKAHHAASAELIVVEERGGQTHYFSQWYVPKDSKIEKLEDLRGKKLAFTSPTSTSGFLFPYAKLIQEGVLKEGETLDKTFDEVLYAGGYEAALKSVAAGRVDAAAASDYALTKYLTPEEQGKLRVLSKQGPVPTHGFAVRSNMKPEVREKVKAALLALNKPENKELLKSVYGAEALVERSHEEHVAALQKAQDAVGAEFPLEPKKADAPAPAEKK